MPPGLGKVAFDDPLQLNPETPSQCRMCGSSTTAYPEKHPGSHLASDFHQAIYSYLCPIGRGRHGQYGRGREAILERATYADETTFAVCAQSQSL